MSGWRALLFGFRGDLAAEDEQAEQRRIGAEVDSELEHHLECLADACRREGIPEAELDRVVRARFGDRNAVRRACMNQRTGGTLMKQQMHRLITAALALAVVGLIAIQWRSRATARAELEALRAELSAFRQNLAERDGLMIESVPAAGIGDRVEVRSLQAELEGMFVVDSGGALLVPNLGRVHVAGLTAEEIEHLLNERAEPYYVAAEIHVALHRAGALERVAPPAAEDR
jgi:hypothetical protein